jgi:glycerophosphoryl diester phosphodiesterase
VKKRLPRLLLAALAATTALWLGNSSRLVHRAGKPGILAHRGMGQAFRREGVGNDTCTATRILPPLRDYVENTLPNIHQALQLGAAVVEIDLQPTRDGHFVVFHDWTLDCRTDGHGVTREHTLEELQALDVGWGYTADGGKTFPYRGHGRGQMPTLDRTLAVFPDASFLLHVKGDDPDEGERLATLLLALPAERRERLAVYGGDRPIAVVRARVSDVRTMSRSSLKRCWTGYLAGGWSGHVPQACTRSILLLPLNYAPLMWGWPDRLLDRMETAGSKLFVTAPYHGEWTEGIDSKEMLAKLPEGYRGGIWTDAIDLIK